MERLADLPTKDVDLTDDEHDVLNTYFGDGSSAGGGTGSGVTWGKAAKVAVISAFLFTIMGNKYFDFLLEKLPYVGTSAANPFVSMGIKMLLFMVVLTLLIKLVVY